MRRPILHVPGGIRSCRILPGHPIFRPTRRLGWANAFAGSTDRYPKVDPAEIEAGGPDLVLLPDEPYVFTAEDGPEAFPHTETRLVSGRLLTWYGPSLLEARSLSG